MPKIQKPHPLGMSDETTWRYGPPIEEGLDEDTEPVEPVELRPALFHEPTGLTLRVTADRLDVIAERLAAAKEAETVDAMKRRMGLS